MAMTQEETFFIIDGSGYIYRAFYALGRLTNSRGMPTQAIYGFAQMLLKVIREKNPSHVCVVFDPPGPSFRAEMYASYKATRQKMPEDLAIQVPYIKEFVKHCGIPQLEMDGYEADDLIAGLTRSAREHRLRVVIVSGDKDLLQLIEDPVVLQWDPQRDKIFGEKEVVDRFGVTSRQFRDFLALVGDSSDNVPGVKGVGEKSAQQLISHWGTLDEIYRNIDKVTPPSVRQKLEASREAALLSRELVSLKEDAPAPFSLEDFSPKSPVRADLMRFYEEHGFKSLFEALARESGDIPSAASQMIHKRLANSQVVRDLQGLARMVQTLEQKESFSITLCTDTSDSMRNHIRGIAFSCEDDAAYFVPFSPQRLNTEREISPRQRLQALEPLLCGDKPGKTGHDLKGDWVVLKRHGVQLKGISFDTMVGSYLLDPGKGSYSVEKIAAEYLGESVTSYESIAGKGKSPRDAGGIDPARDAESACTHAETVWRLVPMVRRKLHETGQDALFDTLELPLIAILAEMEYRGILVDSDKLHSLTRDFQRALDQKTLLIYDLAKEEFNIQSPKQLAYILYDKLDLPVIKKTKSGPSTDSGVLEELALHHPIAEHIITYRSLAKLKGTYADILPNLVHPETGRIHTSYNQAVTATGRLSSSDPNLQNIPIRTEEGRKIREAFIASPGHVLLSADYSQIELRILAHFSEDEHLVEAFQAGGDVHLRTAAEMLNIRPHEVTSEMRRQAKTINFGIIYGMGPYGLLSASRSATRSPRR